MCQSCEARAAKLRELALSFRDLAEQAGEPLFIERLSRTAEELEAIADRPCADCAVADVVWVDPAEDATPDLFAGARA